MQPGELAIVATPIGNLSDITPRALATLRSADLVLCEDTRVTAKLLHHYEITTKTVSYHQHSENAKIKYILDELDAGKHLALVTDAGTPGISDPGNKLIVTILNHNLDVTITPLPGPSAVIAALSVSGFPTDKFVFLGFPPHKKGRAAFFQEIGSSPYTVVFYESSHRIVKCLNELSVCLGGERQLCIARELTKKFESIYRGSTDAMRAKKIPPKGEFVVVVASTTYRRRGSD